MDSSLGSEWELSKENVQPLKSGRRVSTLTAALQPHSTSEYTGIKEEKQYFETELRTYSGDDPLDIWDKYIKWTEQNFPTGGKDSHMSQILERCVDHFKDEEKYRNDPRYLDVWLKFANICSEPAEIYNLMFDQNIGTELAAFYVTWALEMESLGNTKKADKIFTIGIERNAEPVDLLKNQQGQFQMRVARNMMSDWGGNDENPQQAETAVNRNALTNLKMSKKGKVGIDRVAGSRQSQKGVSSCKPLTSNSNSSGFQVFSDENMPSTSGVPAQTGEYKHVPKKSSSRKENEQNPGVWNHAKVKQKSTCVVGISEVGKASEPLFEVHEEDNLEQPTRAPRNVASVDLVLSARKASKKEHDPIKHFQTAQNPEIMQIPMYCKNKIYAGADEFSFEELRAARWTAKRKKKQKEEEQLRIQFDSLMRKKEEEMQEQLKRYAENIKKEQEDFMKRQSEEMKKQQEELLRVKQEAERLKMQEEAASGSLHLNGNPESSAQHNLSAKPSSSSSSFNSSKQHSGSFFNPMPQPVFKSNETTPATNSSIENMSTRNFNLSNVSLNFTSGSSGKNITRSGNPTPISADPTPISTNPTPRSSLPTPKSRNPTPDDSRLLRSGSKGNITMPSPTVNTKEAFGVVMGMFNQSIHLNDIGLDHGKKDDDHDFEGQFAAEPENSLKFMDTKPAPPSVQSAFTVFEEIKPAPPSVQSAFTVFEEIKPAAPSVQSAFTVFEEIKPAAPSVQSAFTVFEEPEPAQKQTSKPPLVYNDENRPTQDYAGSRKRPMMGVLQPSSDIYYEPMPGISSDDIEMSNDEVISKDRYGEEEMMDGVENLQDGNFTFAPQISSTQNFTAAARLVSTPFSNITSVPPLSGPPMSGIKSQGQKHGQTQGDTFMSDTRTAGMSESAFQSYTQQQTENVAPMETNAVTSQSKQVNDTTTQEDGKTTNLSPIQECDEESKESVGSTTHHATHAEMAVSMSNNTTHQVATPAPPKFDVTDPPMQQNNGQITNRTAMEDMVEYHQSSKANVMESCLAEQSIILSPTGCHEIDVKGYVQPELDEHTVNLLSMSIAVDPNDPFDPDLVARFLKRLPQPIEKNSCYYQIEKPMPQIQTKKDYIVGNSEKYHVEACIGKGAYAKVYKVTDIDYHNISDIETLKVMKVQSPPNKWELYITVELQKRLAKLQKDVDVCSSFMTIQKGYFYEDGSIFISDFHENGTILDLVNLHTKAGKSVEKPIIVYLIIEMLHILEKMHACKIIHGDIKPDNIIFKGLPKITKDNVWSVLRGSTESLELIDFGRSIDMKMFPRGTTFTSKIDSADLQCIEMKTNMPWTYQADIFGVLGTIHVLLHGRYMTVFQANGEWKTTKSLNRAPRGEIWQKLFHDLLNIPSCEELPDLKALREQFENYFVTDMVQTFQKCKNNYEVLCFDAQQ